MVNQITNSNINPVQMFSALNAFKSLNQTKEAPQVQDVSDGMGVNDGNTLLKNQDLGEIKQFAKIAGENNLSDEDIQYGVTYGRSVIADYLA